MGSFALPVRYSYDAAGNRVRREIVMSSAPSMSPKKSNSYTDKLSNDYKVKLYPSAQNGTIRVEIISATGMNDGTVEVFSTSGMRVLTCTINDGMAVVDLNNRRSGVYILHICVNGKETDWKIVKQ